MWLKRSISVAFSWATLTTSPSAPEQGEEYILQDSCEWL